jgi:hypothetical protein
MNYFDFGLQRSGTNFIEQIIQTNFNGQRQNRHKAGWKHFIDPPELWEGQHATFLIYKNPYTWVESICFRNTVDWIKTQRTYPALEGPAINKLGPKGISVEQLAKTYKHWHESWIEKPKPTANYNNVVVIRYEDLLREGKRNEVLENIQTKFNAQRKNPNQWNIPQKGKVSQSRDYDKEREEYYLSMKPTKLEARHINAINEIVGTDRIQRLGYEVL